MNAKISTGAIARLLDAATSENVYVTTTFDRWDNSPFYIVDGWEDVRKLRVIAREELVPDDLLAGEEWEEFSTQLASGREDLDLLLGEWSFSDSYTTCSHCGGALCIENNMYSEWYLNYDTGDIACNKCTRENFGDEYLTYCASHWEDENFLVAHHSYANPREYGFVRLNYWEDEEEGIEGENHRELPYDIEYANYDDLRRLGKAIRLVDDSLQVVCQHHPLFANNTYVYWARFDPNSDWADSPDALNYAIGRVFAKYHALRRAGTGTR
jgi:hypothetical protein